jgi:Mg-chelatase subunit ChlD
MKTKLLVTALFALTAGVVAAYPMLDAAPPAGAGAVAAAPSAAPAAIAPRPKVEVVFVLDTTGSMSGLIDAAKENIWAIASSMAQAQPAPELRLGLVAFRDRGDDYVTRVVDLSPDLDSMYATLMDFRADGGGDTPESVNQALYDAVHKMSWSTQGDAYRVVFLVGDAPPQMGYPDDVKYPETIAAAMRKGIVVNTILAGGDPTAEQAWMRIAGLNQGKHFKVGQQGDAIAVATPFDAQIADLSRDLDETRLYYGDAAAQADAERKEAATAKLHAGGSVAARAKRAMYNASAAGKDNLLGGQELVEAVSSGRVALDDIAPEQLPEPLRTLDRDAQAAAIAVAAEERRTLDTRIAELSAQRQAFIADELGKRADAPASLDVQIFEAVKEQAGKKGLRYEAAAPVH